MLKELEQLTAPDRTDREAMVDLLGQGFFRRTLGAMVRELEGKKAQLSVVDLSEESGLLKAVKLQGEIAGMWRFLGLLTEKEETESE